MKRQAGTENQEQEQEIEITLEMSEAGYAELDDANLELDALSEVVCRIYRAMESHRR